MLASELYALSQSRKCDGPWICHWCGGPCDGILQHDDPGGIPFIKGVNPQQAKRLTSPYYCIGCWLWRRTSLTATFLDGSYKDRQMPIRHSWWITKDGATAINWLDKQRLLPLLLKPPCSFCVALIDEPIYEPNKQPIRNEIHLAFANDISVIKAETTLQFTINNTAHTYNVYELEQATKYQGLTGRMPGVRALIKWMELPPPKPLESSSGRKYASKIGNPKQLASDPCIKATVRMSGIP